MNRLLRFFHLENYRSELFGEDIKAALTVSVVAIPQSMAFAMIAGLNPVYGLYTAIIPLIIGSLLDSSNYMYNGPTNALCVLSASIMAGMSGVQDPLPLLFLITFVAGALQLLFGLMRLGNVVNFISHSVMVGFMTGAGLLIGMGQFYKTLGLSLPGNAAFSPLEKLLYALTHLGESNPYVLGLTALTLTIVLAAKRISKKIPGPLIAILITGGLCALFRLDGRGVSLTGEIPRGLPAFTPVVISVDRLRTVGPQALAVAIIGLVQSASIAKTLAQESGEYLNSNREFISQGIQNMVGAQFQCLPSGGSFTQSILNYYSGAKSRISGVFIGIFTALIFLFFGRFAEWIPSATLAALIMMTALNLLKVGEFKKAFSLSREEGAVAVITLLGTILLPSLNTAIYLGVIVSFIAYFKKTGEAHLRILLESDGVLEEQEHLDEDNGEPYLILQLEGILFFGNADDLSRKLSEVNGRSRIFIIRFKRVTSIDLTAAEMLRRFREGVLNRGGTVLFCGVSQGLGKVFVDSRLLKGVKEEDLFFAGNQLLQSTYKAIERARFLSGKTKY
jgi:sulfate permease, SulP family